MIERCFPVVAWKILLSVRKYPGTFFSREESSFRVRKTLSPYAAELQNPVLFSCTGLISESSLGEKTVDFILGKSWVRTA